MNLTTKLKKVIRRCPVCLGEIADTLHGMAFILPESYSLSNSYDVVMCQLCGFVYADTSASQEDYDFYYKELSKYEDNTTGSGGGVASWDIERLERTASDLSNLLPNRDVEILDIGCANGGLLTAFKRQGYNRIVGLDPSTICVRNVKRNGIEAVVGGLFDLKTLDNRQFDCIILSHVLEHIVDVQASIENLIISLKDGGLLYIEVPDASRYAQYYVVPDYYFDIEHINHFDEFSLQNLILKYGFKTLPCIKKEIQISKTDKYPVVGMIFLRTSLNRIESKMTINQDAYRSVVKYIEMSRQSDIFLEIDQFVESQEKIVVWGAGSYTQRLLNTTSLRLSNIIAFIDNDSKKQGMTIEGIPIYSPIFLKDLMIPIIICSALHSDDIVSYIQRMGLSNRIVVLK